MISIFESLRNLVKISQVKIDNSVLVLHYPVSVILLLAFCVIVTAKEYVGKPIECLTDESIPVDIINTFCWMYTTFTIPQASYNFPLQSYPGIDDTMDEKQFKYHGYYQWVAFVLFIQAICFYLPHWLWKFWEGGKLEALSKPVNEAIYSGRHLQQKQHNLVKYLVSSRGSHDSYSFRFFICESLALVNISLQLYFLDKLFEGEFRQYGLEVINFLLVNDEQRIDPMARIFPKVTKCRFKRYGPSAGLDSVDALCLLPLNIINEKIYIFLWFWFLLLFLLTALTLVIHIMVISSRSLWLFVTKLTYSWSSSQHIKPIIQKSTYGDWFFLYMLGSNIDPVVLKNVLCELADNDDSINDSCDL